MVSHNCNEKIDDVIELICNGKIVGDSILGISIVKNDSVVRLDSGTIPKTNLFEKTVNDSLMSSIYGLTFVIKSNVYDSSELCRYDNIYYYEGSFELVDDKIKPIITKITHDLAGDERPGSYVKISELIGDQWVENYYCRIQRKIMTKVKNSLPSINVTDKMLIEILDRYSNGLSNIVCWYLETIQD